MKFSAELNFAVNTTRSINCVARPVVTLHILRIRGGNSRTKCYVYNSKYYCQAQAPV